MTLDTSSPAAPAPAVPVSNKLSALVSDMVARVDQGEHVIVTSAEEMASASGLAAMLTKAKTAAVTVEAKVESVPFTTYLQIANIIVVLGILVKLAL